MNNISSEIPDQIQPPNPKLTVSLPLQIPVGEMLQDTTTLVNVIVSPIKQATQSTIASAVVNKQESVSNATASNVPDGLYKGIFDTNSNVKTPYVGLFDTNRYRNNDYSQSTDTVTYSSSCSSNYTTHLFLLVIAIYITLRRNGGFSVGPVLAAFCCPHIYILYAFYNGFCATP